MTQRAPHRYVFVETVESGRPVFVVLCIHDATPDWWNVVARFEKRARAEAYADVENMMADDGEQPIGEQEVAAPVERLPLSPPSRITREAIRPPTPAEKARVGAHLITGAAQETGEPVTVRVQRAPRRTKAEMRAVAALPPKRHGRPAPTEEEVERRVSAVLTAIRALATEDAKISYPTIAERVDIPTGSIAPAIAILRGRGLIQTFVHGQMDAAELREKGGIRLVTTPAANAPEASEEIEEPDLRAEIESEEGLADDAAAPAPQHPWRGRGFQAKPARATMIESMGEFLARGGKVTALPEFSGGATDRGIPANPTGHVRR